MNKTILMTTLILMSAAGPAFAGCGMCGVGEAKKGHHAMKEELAAEKVKKMTKQLDLSAEQAKQLEAIMQEKMDKKKAVHEETEKKMDAIREDFQAKLKTVLTPEQLEKYNSMKDKKEDNPGKKHKKHNNE